MYFKVVKDIFENYKELLVKEELVELYDIIHTIKDLKDEEIEDNIIIFINNILNKIWDKTLTDVSLFKNGNNFCFLVKEIDYIVDIVTLQVEDINKNKLYLVNDNNIMDYDIGKFGYIIKLDYRDSKRTTPLLPIYFINKDLSVDKLNYQCIGTYSIDTKVGELDSNSIIAKEKSIEYNVPNINLDKMLYRKNNNSDDLLSKVDLNEIALIFLVKYSELKKDYFKILIKNKFKYMKNKKVHNELLKYYNGKLSLHFLKAHLYAIFEDITNELDRLDNKNKKVL